MSYWSLFMLFFSVFFPRSLDFSLWVLTHLPTLPAFKSNYPFCYLLSKYPSLQKSQDPYWPTQLVLIVMSIMISQWINRGYVLFGPLNWYFHQLMEKEVFYLEHGSLLCWVISSYCLLLHVGLDLPPISSVIPLNKLLSVDSHNILIRVLTFLPIPLLLIHVYSTMAAALFANRIPDIPALTSLLVHRLVWRISVIPHGGVSMHTCWESSCILHFLAENL